LIGTTTPQVDGRSFLPKGSWTKEQHHSETNVASTSLQSLPFLNVPKPKGENLLKGKRVSVAYPTLYVGVHGITNFVSMAGYECIVD
jgi:hypothetical protein